MLEKLDTSVWQCNDSRITPACAGKTPLIKDLLTKSWDHPRVCGKNYRFLVVAIHLVGSPPRVREKLTKPKAKGTGLRITPACAGKTLSESIFEVSTWDHPRVCGKNLQSSRLKCWIMGSPPRVREKLGISPLIQPLYRITPACAGKTL